MKIFVTGIAGFLGGHIAEKLIEDGHEVSGCDNLIGGYLENVPDDANFYQTDAIYLNQMVKMTKDADLVVHTACTAYEGLSVFSPYFVGNNTYQISLSVFSAIAKNNIPKVINFSSMARYGTQEKTPFTEDQIPKPQDPYGIAKVAVENTLDVLSEVHNFEYVNLVPHNIIGPRQKYDDPFRNVVSIMINRMIQNKAPIIYGDGKQTRCFSYIDDCLSCLLPMLDQKNLNKQTINIGPDEEFVTINKIAELCSNITGTNLQPIYKKDRPKEVKHATCSADKARNLLNYKTTVDLKEGIQKTFDYIKKRGARPFDYNINIEINNELTPSTWKNKEI